MNNKLLPIILGLLLFGFGCSGRTSKPTATAISSLVKPIGSATVTPSITPNSPTVSATSTITSIPTRSLTPTRTHLPTKKPTPTPVPASTKTSTPTIEPMLYLNIAPEIPITASISGTLVMVAESGSYLLDLKTGNQKKIGTDDESSSPIGVSPNREWLAYIIDTSNPTGTWLAVRSADGNHQGKVEILERWWYGGWIGNDRILFRKIIGGRENEGIENKFTAPAIVVNPFTGELQKIPVNYPGLEEAARYFDFRSSMMMTYDTSLNVVIYPQFDVNDDYCYYSLWNRQAQKMLARIKTGGCFVFSNPIWLPDESGFLIATFGEWFQVNRNGEVRQLSHLRDSFPSVFIYPYVDLSPDGNYLAFSYEVNLGPSSESQLAVLNMKTSEVTYYGAVPDNYPGSSYDLAWSPDSRYLAVGIQDVNGRLSTIVIDIVDRWAAHLVDNALPIGWMK